MFVTVRHFLDRDFDEVLAIEDSSFEFPWTKKEFLDCLRTPKSHKIFPKCVGLIAESNELVVGYLIYKELNKAFKVLNVAVQESQRRLGVLTQMMNRLSLIATRKNKERIVLEVRETNLQAQIAFRAYGFKATKVLKHRYDDTETTEDAYKMVFRPQCKILQA
jgi:ribosomal-protein-alanine N-acetyltransferase